MKIAADRIAAKYLRRKTAGYPTSMTEWESYVKGLAGEELFSKTLAANTQAFADSLRKDGHTMADFQRILLMLVRQCIAADVRLPVGGAFDLAAMAQQDPIARRGKTLPLEKIENLERSQALQSPAATDDVDMLMAEMEADIDVPEEDDADDDQ